MPISKGQVARVLFQLVRCDYRFSGSGASSAPAGPGGPCRLAEAQWSDALVSCDPHVRPGLLHFNYLPPARLISYPGTPNVQVIITGCWLTMKECSLLLGTLARSVPIAGACTAWVPCSWSGFGGGVGGACVCFWLGWGVYLGGWVWRGMWAQVSMSFGILFLSTQVLCLLKH